MGYRRSFVVPLRSNEGSGKLTKKCVSNTSKSGNLKECTVAAACLVNHKGYAPPHMQSPKGIYFIAVHFILLILSSMSGAQVELVPSLALSPSHNTSVMCHQEENAPSPTLTHGEHEPLTLRTMSDFGE